jgi:phosphate/sulfate permease
VCGLGTSIGYGMVKEIVHFQRVKWVIIAWFILAPITDTVISAALVWYLVSVFHVNRLNTIN